MHIRKCGKGGGTKLGPRYFGGGFCVDGAGVWWREAHFFLKDRKKVVILKFVIIICCCFFLNEKSYSFM